MGKKASIFLVMAGLTSGAAMAEELRAGVYRTPDERFENLPGYDFEPHYQDIQG